jgi:hypothetical protein
MEVLETWSSNTVRQPLDCEQPAKPGVFPAFAGCSIWSRPAKLFATEVLAGRVLHVRGHMDDAGLCGESD